MLSWLHAIPYPDIDPVFLRVGPLQFRWYGLMYLIGLTLAYFIIAARARAQKLPMNNDQVYDMIVYAAVGVFAGGRLGYVLFYNLSYYLENPLILFARRQGMTVLTIADLAAGVTPVGLGLGRIGNFINGELYGRPTDVDWCMVFPAGGMACRHPSQLYEAFLEGLLLFTVLWLITRRLPPSGTVFGAFLMGYGICRIVVEFFREPDAQIGFLVGTISMGQMLSIPMIVAGAVILAIAAQRKRPLQPDSGTAAPL